MGFGRRLWQALLKVRDPFGQIARANDERRLLGKRRHARERLKALEAAAACGEDVAAEVVIAEAEIDDVTALMPRGSTAHFLGSVVVCAWVAAGLAGWCADFGEGIGELWGTLDNSYLLEHSYAATRICQVGQWITASVVSGVVLGALWILLWHVQRGLQRRHAVVLLVGVDLTVFAVGIVLVFAQVQVSMVRLPVLS